MKKLCMVVALAVSCGFGQELAFETGGRDTNVYGYSDVSFDVLQNLNFSVGYNVALAWADGRHSFFDAAYNKVTHQYDIFSLQTKIASLTPPAFSINDSFRSTKYAFVSQTVFNSDLNWECLWIVEWFDSTYKTSMILATSTGTPIWSTKPDETGNIPRVDLIVQFDGTNVYIRATRNDYLGYRYYRFRPLLSASPALSKSAASPGIPIPLFSTGYSGDLRIKLKPSGGGATTVSLFNLRGQELFKQIIPNLNKEVTLTVPSQRVPGSPIVAKVQNKNGSGFSKTVRVE